MKLKATSMLALSALVTSALLVAPDADSVARDAIGRNVAEILERQSVAPELPVGAMGKANSYLTAHALRLAAEKQAWADFWNQIGNILNDTSVIAWTAMGNAWLDLQDDLDLVEDQFAARLATIAALGTQPYDPQLDPSEFSADVTNPYFPLVVGRTLVYERQLASGLERVEMTTTNQVRLIDGFPCRVVRVRETIDDDLVEETTDWYSQDSSGNVWYFGELSMSYDDHGFIDDLEGSWRAGKDGGKPGIVMKANPVVNEVYRQEWLVNEAEDIGCVLATGQTITVPTGTYTSCIRIQNSSPVEPEENEEKWYAPNVGLVADDDANTGQRLELVAIIN